MQYTYKTSGTCSQKITLEIKGNIVSNVKFEGGCNGNLKGICSLVDGMTIEEIQRRLGGIQCGFKGTSCPDQLSIAVRKAYEASLAQ